MAWNETTRAQYRWPLERFETDVADAEWALIEPLLSRLRGRVDSLHPCMARSIDEFGGRDDVLRAVV